MWDVILALAIGFAIYWYFSTKHPSKFPPGPRFPLPIVGDAYVLGEDVVEGFDTLCRKASVTQKQNNLCMHVI